MASHTISSLNAHKSSTLPPPRPTTTASASSVSAYPKASAMSRPERSPWTKTSITTSSTNGHRLLATRCISCSAAPVAEVTNIIFLGNLGNVFLRVGSKYPLASNFFLSCSNAIANAPAPKGSALTQFIWYSPRGAYSDSAPCSIT